MKLGIAGAAVLGCEFETPARDDMIKSDWLIYVGTYTSGTKSRGIYVLRADRETGGLKQIAVAEGVTDPSFLAISRDRRFLFAANELLEFEGNKSGSVSSFAIDNKSGSLRFINRVASRGAAPCFVATSNDGRFVAVANYLGGNAGVFPVAGDGGLGKEVSLVQHNGFGPNGDRQEAAHAHSIDFDRNNRYAFAADLGIDRLMIYKFDSATGVLTPNAAQPFFQTKPGAGPRHFEFHPAGRFLYLINELNLSITALAFDPEKGLLSEIQTVPTLPPGARTARATCADIHLSPDGKFVYGSNRGHNSIVCYAVDQTDGRLTYVSHFSEGVSKPRNFAITPDGTFLIVANQDAGSVIVLRRDKTNGKLSSTGFAANVPAAVCLRMIPASVR